MKQNRPQSVTRINTRLETFLAKKLGYENVDFYEQERCVEDIVNNKFLGKFKYRLLIVCSDRIYITDNPPKNLDCFIAFDDITEIKTLDDIPKFLSGAERENALHICIKYFKNPKRNNQLLELRNKIIELKKDMLYSKTLHDKLVELDMNSPRLLKNSYLPSNLSTFRSFNNDFGFVERGGVGEEELRDDFKFTNQSGLSTNRTNKSVHFEDSQSMMSEPENTLKSSGTTNKTEQQEQNDYLLNKAVNQRYKNLVELFTKNNQTDVLNNENFLSLSLPLTPRSLTMESEYSDVTYISKKTSKSIESINENYSLKFVADNDKTEHSLNIYILNPETTIFQTLKNAHFYSKIRATLDYHSTCENESKVLKSVKKHNEIDRKFRQMSKEIISNRDDLLKLTDLLDELLCAVNNYKVIKQFFWNSPELYQFVVMQIGRYLPKSPANMKSDKAPARRIDELNCVIGLIETLSVMFNESEFFQNRNEILYEEKCSLLMKLVEILLGEPEMPIAFENKQNLEIKTKDLVFDLTIVSAILLWDILHFMSLNSWNNEHFNLVLCVKLIENSQSFESFVHKTINELVKIFTHNGFVVLNGQYTIICFKIFEFFNIIIDKSTTKTLKQILVRNYQEEFKYYFCEDQIKLKSYNYYPISTDLLNSAKKLSALVLN